jgi:hypothetical protein
LFKEFWAYFLKNNFIFNWHKVIVIYLCGTVWYECISYTELTLPIKEDK